MERGKYKVDVENKTVTFGHKTKTSDGHVDLTTTFSFASVVLERLLYFAGAGRLITWRAGSGIKDLTTTEALAKFQDVVVDCAKTVERVKHTETEDEKVMKAYMIEAKARATKEGKSDNLRVIMAHLRDVMDEAEGNAE